MKQIAIFASGTGSNAHKIIEYLQNKRDVKVGLIVSNNKTAGVLKHAESFNIPFLILTKTEAQDGSILTQKLRSYSISFVVLAGYLQKIPPALIKAFPKSIVNIHPALLPKHGGKGMYGQRVHQAVIDSGEKESGITIHYVNEQYDEGGIIAQFKCPVLDSDNAEQLAHRVLKLEHQHFPEVVYQLITHASVS